MKFNKKIKRYSIIVLITITSLIGFSFVNEEFKIVKNFDIFYTLYKELSIAYVDDLDSEKLIKTGIDAMLETLDPYTVYVPESDADDFKFQTTGQYGGIGSVINRQGSKVIIAEPYEGSPSFKIGLKPGDEIINIDNKPIDNNDISKVSDRLRGTPGTKVLVEIKRFNEKETKQFTITREKITIPNVPFYGMINDTVGYIKLTGFNPFAGLDVKDALIALKKKNAQAVILDLRSNPGGSLEESINVTNAFVQKGEDILLTKGRIKELTKNYKTMFSAVDTSIRLAVLINRGSASASEIVAGSLQDLDRAVIIGQRSFGKGLVQTVRPLSYNTQLKVTTAKYYIPSGRCIQALDYTHKNEDGSVGIVPDSLITAFKTKHGRTVYDGGGISPDIINETEKLSNISISLYTNYHFFNFATEYFYKNPIISDVRQFEITDTIYNSFINYLSDKEYDYKTKSEEDLKKLIETAKNEKYFSLSEKEFEALKLKLGHDKNKDLINFKNEISKFLKDEIIGRYYYQKGRIESSLKDDDEVIKAVEILTNKAKYLAILSGKEGELSKRRDLKKK